MAKFQEVGRQWARMCKAFRTLPNGCSGCPLVNENCYHESPFALDFDHIEYAVMQWTAENPEPIYPTWLELAVQQGFKIEEGKQCTDEEQLLILMMASVNTPIPADIAQKLGIKPIKPKKG